MYSKMTFQSAAEDLQMLRAAVLGRAGPAQLAEPRRRQALVAHLRQARRMARLGGTPPLAADASEATFLSITCNDTAWQGDRATLRRIPSASGRRTRWWAGTP